MALLSVSWRSIWMLVLASSVVCIALGCGPPRKRVQAHPTAGAVSPDELRHPTSLEDGQWDEPSEVEQGAPPPSDAEPADGPVPKRRAGTNQVPDNPYRNVRATLYRKEDHNLCDYAESLLRSKGVPLTVKYVENDAEARAAARRKLKRAGFRKLDQVPVIDINGRVINGYRKRIILETLEKVRTKEE